MMDNIFSNASLVVESSGFTMKSSNPLSVASDSALANEKLREMKIAAENARIQDRIDAIGADYDKQQVIEQVVSKSVLEAQLPNKINGISVQGKTILFKEILFEVFYNALLMDDYFLQENVNTIRTLTDKYVDDNKGFALLENAIAQSKSNLLKKIKSICEGTANKVCDRKIKEFHECNDPNCLSFNMIPEEQEEFDYAKGEINIDKISDLVKNKVLTVVKDEKTRQEEESKVIEEIEEDLKENENVKDEKSLNEALEKIIINKSPVQDSTLFNALFKNCYKEAILENVAITSTDQQKVEDDRAFSATYKINATEDDINSDNLDNNTHNIEEDDIDDNIALEGMYEKSSLSKKESSINMDMVLTEAITKYTLMETLYTLKLENYTYNNIAKLARKLVN